MEDGVLKNLLCKGEEYCTIFWRGVGYWIWRKGRRFDNDDLYLVKHDLSKCSCPVGGQHCKHIRGLREVV